VYLMGNSSGGSAVWNIGAKYPQLWTAISPSAAPLDDAHLPVRKLRSLPVLVVHGDMDTTMVFDGSKMMVDHAKAKAVNATWLPVRADSTWTPGLNRRSSVRRSTSSTSTGRGGAGRRSSERAKAAVLEPQRQEVGRSTGRGQTTGKVR
jgi:poly(3-hydroxybutyrate) depolymerase